MIIVKDAVGNLVDVERIKFPAGELHARVKLNGRTARGVFHIWWDFEATAELTYLALIVDAIRNAVTPDTAITLAVPYFPFARQDRVAVQGDAHALRVVCLLLQSLRFSRITTYDLHSPVAEILLQNLEVIPQHKLLRKCITTLPVPLPSPLVVVAPDAGAEKKALDCVHMLKAEMYTATKVRDPQTGEILGVGVVRKIPEDAPLLIVDDICDGGRTFIELAKSIKEAHGHRGPRYLYVTHGIFSKGYEVLKEHFTGILVANLMRPDRDPIVLNPPLRKTLDAFS